MKYVHLFLNEATENKNDTCGLHSISIGLVGKSPWHFSRGRARRVGGEECHGGRLSIALAWVPCSPQLPRRPGAEGLEHREEGKAKKLQQPLFLQKRVRTGRQGQAEANLPRIVLFPGFAPCLDHKLWGASVWGGVAERPNIEPFLP